MDMQHYNSISNLERSWMEDVYYLHSLWHQGPPQNPQSPNLYIHNLSHQGPPQNPSLHLHSHWYQGPPQNSSLHFHSLWHQGPPQNPRLNHNLHSLNALSFKKVNKTKKRKQRRHKKKKKANQHSDLGRCGSSVSDIEWPVEPPPEPQPQSGWGDPNPKSTVSLTRRATAEEQMKFSAIQLQRNALKSSQTFFSKEGSSDDEEDDEEDDEVEEDLMEEETENFKFFIGLFTDDDNLRTYYEKNFEHGVFFCLACGGVGEKMRKKFGNCVALVQHSAAISKTKGKNAHRAFGKAVCKVLGWDINRLPSIVLDSGEPLSCNIAKTETKETMDASLSQTGNLSLAQETTTDASLSQRVGLSLPQDTMDASLSATASLALTQETSNASLSQTAELTITQETTDAPLPDYIPLSST